jgi:hypothetical protein
VLSRDFDVLRKAFRRQLAITAEARVRYFQMLVCGNVEPLQRLADIDSKRPPPGGVQGQ